MKLNKLIFGLAVLLVTAGGLQAQTPTPSIPQGVQEMAAALAKAPWTALAGYGQGINDGHHKLYFTDFAYDFTPTNMANVGIVVGYDQLTSTVKGESGQFNAVKGGVNLSVPIHPFAFIGSTFLTNVIGNPFVADLLATPKGGSNIGNIVDSGCDFDLYAFSNFELSVQAHYENRSGEDYYNGNYWGVSGSLSRKF
jgi:hypothetical protein